MFTTTVHGDNISLTLSTVRACARGSTPCFIVIFIRIKCTIGNKTKMFRPKPRPRVRPDVQDQDQDQDRNCKTKTKTGAGLRPVLS